MGFLHVVVSVLKFFAKFDKTPIWLSVLVRGFYRKMASNFLLRISDISEKVLQNNRMTLV